MAKIKRTDNIKILEVGGATKISYVVGESVKQHNYSKKSGGFL